MVALAFHSFALVIVFSYAPLMRAITCRCAGEEDVMQVEELPTPEPEDAEILIEVSAAGVNRADLLQRRGLYPPPPGTTDILGLEVSGTVVKLGPGASAFSVGDPVMALLPGGGYASHVTVDQGSAIKIPDTIRTLHAAAIPEAFLTAYLNLFLVGQIKSGKVILFHGGSGGVGTAAIQLANVAGCEIIVTAGSPKRCRRCIEMGASAALNHNTDDWVKACLDHTEGHGVDLVVDCIGASYFESHLKVLAPGGHLVIIGLMGGYSASLDLRKLLAKRITVHGSTLRSRTTSDKTKLIDGFWSRFGSAFARGELRPVIDRIYTLDHAADAHRALAQGEVFGKLILRT